MDLLTMGLGISSGGAIRFNDAYTFPTADGSSNQILRTNGSGTLSFATFSVGIDQIDTSDILTSSESFSDSNDFLMTAAAINDRIESFGYGTGTMSSWTLEGDSGSTTVTNGNTVDIAGGTGITTVASLDSGRDTVTVNFSAGTNDLSDVSINSGTLANGQILQYSSAESAFVNATNQAITMSGSTTNGVLTRNTSTQATVESALLFSGSTLEINNTGDWSFIKNNTNSGGLRFGTKDSGGTYDNQIEISHTGGYVKLNEDVFIPVAKRLYFGDSNHTYISEDQNDRLRFFCGGAEFMRFGESTTDTLTLYADNAARVQVTEAGLKVVTGAIGVNTNALGDNGSIVATNDVIAGQGGGSVAMTINDGGGNANLTFNHRNKTPDQDGNSGRIEVNVDSSGGAYMAFEVASSVTSGTSVNTSEKLRIDDAGVDINGNVITGNASNPTLEIRNTASSAGSGPSLIFGHSQSGTSSVAKIDTHLTDGSESGRAGHLDFHTSQGGTMSQKFRIDSDGSIIMNSGEKFYLDGKSDTYFYNPSGSDTIDFVAGGQQMLRMFEGGTDYVHVDDNTRLGVGNDPDLVIYHTSGASYISNDTGMFTIRNTASNQDIRFTVNDGGSTSNLLTLNSASSRVGIMNTAPTHALHVTGDIRSTGKFLCANNTGFTEYDAAGNIATLVRQDTGDILFIGDSNHTEQIKIQSANSTGNGYIHCQNNGNIGFSGNTSFSSPMTVNYGAVFNEGGNDSDTRIEGSSDANLFRADAGNDRIGIGSGSPGGKLHVHGITNANNLIVSASMHNVGGGHLSNYQTLLFKNTYNETGYAAIRHFANSHNDSASQLRFLTSNTSGTMNNQMTVDDTGRIGIGTTSPSLSYANKGLEIQAADEQVSLRLERTGSSPNVLEISARNSDTLIYNVGTARNFRFGIAGTEEFRMDTSGNFHADADVIAFSTTTASDIKFKENVNSIPYGLKEVLQMNPVEFDWIEKRNGTHDIGFIAQEMEKIVPEVIKETETLEVGGTHKTMDYAKLTSILVQAIQEQQEQINKLKEQLNG